MFQTVRESLSSGPRASDSPHSTLGQQRAGTAPRAQPGPITEPKFISPMHSRTKHSGGEENGEDLPVGEPRGFVFWCLFFFF